jgi:hypothetical protein
VPLSPTPAIKDSVMTATANTPRLTTDMALRLRVRSSSGLRTRLVHFRVYSNRSGGPTAVGKPKNTDMPAPRRRSSKVRAGRRAKSDVLLER